MGTSEEGTKNELRSLEKGIGPNYVGDDLLENQDGKITSWFSSGTGLGIIIFPPAAYLLVLVPVYVKRKRRQDVAVLQARKALSEFTRQMKRLEKNIDRIELQQTVDGIAESLKLYLRRRLHLPPGAIIYNDVTAQLKLHGVAEGLLAEMKTVLDWCEAYRYGAADKYGGSSESLREMLVASLASVKKIDQCLQK